MSMLDLHNEALDVTGSYIAGVRDDQWEASTPCSEWNVRALVNHVTAHNLWVGELAQGKTVEEVGDRLDGDVLGEDPVAAYEESARIAREAFARPGAMQQLFHLSYGDVPGEMYAGNRFLDVLVHGWDIATATGQDADLDPALASRCQEVAEDRADAIRGSDGFGPEVAVPPTADAQDKLLGLTGRTR